MKTLKTALILFTLFSVILGLLYPFAMTGIAQLTFPYKAKGSMIINNSKIVGSELIGQSFSQEVYFQGRPSAVNYDGNGSGASNLGPTEPKLQEQISERLRIIREINAFWQNQCIPSDLIMSSASGLDPHISTASAMLQVPRIAKARHMNETDIQFLISSHTENLLVGVPYVNVLKLNLALNELNIK